VRGSRCRPSRRRSAPPVAPDGERLYLHYTKRNGDNVISEFPVPAATNEAGAERVLLEVPEPYSNHNGGDLTFGPDGHLYIGLGDGGAGGDPEQNGQDLTTLLGAILRIEPTANGDQAYTVPADNPYADGVEGRPEIWTWGLRNPWRFSFDAATGDLWIADVGQNLMEEINRLPADSGGGRGANLGWNRLEGTLAFAGDPPDEHVLPIFEYDHNDGRCSVTGGFVYRGGTLPVLDGVYLYADYCVAGIAGLATAGNDAPRVAELNLDRRPANVISFGQGPDGEIYVMEAEGAVSRIQVADWPWTVIRP
ncbi:MAG: PQQ-dependent sugar dehydrogenase, partial [Actinomycetota bacterium]